MTSAERRHIERIKRMPCGVCGEGDCSDAHHILDCGRRISHYMVIPLCKNCHQDNHNGIHGRQAMWRIMHKTELIVLAETIERLFR